MSVRNIEIPVDLQLLGNLILQSFTYPENPAWSVQDDEKESIIQSLQSMQRFWPLINLTMWLSPVLRDQMRGVFWEENGQVVGSSLFQRRGTSQVWTIATVGVLPAYRRRGIARKLVEYSLEEIRQRGGKIALLDVIEGNLPAYMLYESLGFEAYSGMVETSLVGGTTLRSPAVLPTGYSQQTLSPYDWQTRYEMDRRIMPANLLKFEPVEPDRYRTPATMRLLQPVMLFVQRVHEEQYLVKHINGQVVARYQLSASKRSKGLNSVLIRVDPAHAILAPYCINFLFNRLNALRPGLRIQLDIPWWQECVLTAAEAIGFVRRMALHRMGILLR